ncbi:MULTISPECIES: hypothetical protein [Bacillaceae]|nr:MULTISPECIES: hypothetical protein [Bacillaceae]MDO6654785.1 hypothetical protein [Anaerobacillus sp. 1_MG-2023]
MTEALLDFMLGPFSIVGDFYFEHQVTFNTVIVCLAFYKLSRRRSGNESA